MINVRSRLGAGLAGLLTLGVMATPSFAAPDPRPGSPAVSPDAEPAAPTASADGWTVTPTGPASYELAWRSPSALPVVDAQPTITYGGEQLPARLSRDGRTVSVLVNTAIAPSPTELDATLGTQPLDGAAAAPAETGPEVPYERPAYLADVTVDPGVRGDHEIRESTYGLAPIALPDISQDSEMVGRIVEPVDATADTPLVLFLHGRHNPCFRPRPDTPALFPFPRAPGAWHCPGRQLPVPSYLGYEYAQRLLASQGYVTVSISADAINALDYAAQDGGAEARATLIRRHLAAWRGFVNSREHPADLGNVVLVGHSRGGEGADRASIEAARDSTYTISGQVLIGPTDFGFQSAQAVPTVTVLPYCDGDVSDLQGQNFTDVPRDLGGDLAWHSSVLVMGANHNFFNSEWTPGDSVAPSFDDWFFTDDKVCGSGNPARLDGAQQRLVGKSYIAGAVQLFASGNQGVLPMYDGSRVSVPSADRADVRTHALGGGTTTYRPGLDATAAPSTADSSLCVGVSDSRLDQACEYLVSSGRTPHWPSSFFRGVPRCADVSMSWVERNQSAGLTLDAPADWTAMDHVDLRTIVKPGAGPVELSVRLTDSAGRSAVVTPVADGQLNGLPGLRYSLAKRWAQVLRLRMVDVHGIDLASVTGVELVARSVIGQVWLLDVTAVPQSGVVVDPTAALPVVDFGRARQVEGDGPDPATVEVPYTVQGTLTAPARMSVVPALPFQLPDGPIRQVTIPAGTTSGVVELTYQPDEVDDPGRRILGVTAYGTRGVQTGSYLGQVAIIDDDPPPSIHLTRDPARTPEGSQVTFTLRLSSPAGYYVVLLARPVRQVEGKQVTVGDLPKGFRRRHFDTVPPLDTPLYRSGLFLAAAAWPGQTEAQIVIPFRHTTRDDGPRKLSMRFRVPRFTLADNVRTTTVVEAAG